MIKITLLKANFWLWEQYRDMPKPISFAIFALTFGIIILFLVSGIVARPLGFIAAGFIIVSNFLYSTNLCRKEWDEEYAESPGKHNTHRIGPG